MHWPIPLNSNGNHPVIPTLPDGKRDIDHSWKISDTWKQMEAVLKKGPSLRALFILQPVLLIGIHEGKVKSIGVSNFSQAKLEEILPTAEVIPAVDQVSRFVPLHCALITVYVYMLAGTPRLQPATQPCCILEIKGYRSSSLLSIRIHQFPSFDGR